MTRSRFILRCAVLRLWCRIAHRDDWRQFQSDPGYDFCLHCGSRHKIKRSKA